MLLSALCGLVVVLPACGEDEKAGGGQPGQGGQQQLSGNIAGAGSSAQEAAMEAWIAGFQTANPDATVSYDPVGSGGGREQFIAGGTVFAGSDAALDEEELPEAEERCGGADNLIEMPLYVSPIAVAYNLPGVDNLQLSPDAVAEIFRGDITQWNDPAIAETNPGVQLPDLRITPVHRSDESGTTENFTEYLNEVVPRIWTDEPDGNWPLEGGEAAQGTSGVVRAIQNGEGAVGYADASQARELGVARIQVGEAFVEPSREAAAAILDNSQEVDGGGRYVFAYELDRQTEQAGTYPVVLVSYELACTRYDSPQEAALVKGLMSYVLGEQGQMEAAQAAGSAPISDALRQKVQPAVDAIGG